MLILVAPHNFFLLFKTKKYKIYHEMLELWSVTYIQTKWRRFFFLRMRLLASPFGLAIKLIKKILCYILFKVKNELPSTIIKEKTRVRYMMWATAIHNIKWRRVGPSHGKWMRSHDIITTHITHTDIPSQSQYRYKAHPWTLNYGWLGWGSNSRTPCY